MPELDAVAERHLVAVVSDEPEHYRAIREHLGDSFRIAQARDEDEIQKVFENADVHAVLFDLDCVGEGAGDGLEVLGEMRRLRDDLVLAAFTRATQRTLPLKAAQAGADEFFLVPLNFEERTGHLPHLLHDVINRLRLESGTKSSISEAAGAHGALSVSKATRWRWR